MSVGADKLKLAVVGHTNAGKTSLVRTLLRSREFGDVANRGGTTRQVISAPLQVDGSTLIEIYDSPGLENAPDLIEWLEALPGERHDGPERIAQLLDDVRAREQFDHEARVLALMLEVDVGLYVIDAREPVLEKYRDELAILALCATPIVAVLNFTASKESREAEWRDALSRVTLHTVLSFDAVVRDPATEARLFQKLAGLLDSHSALLGRWLVHREEEERLRRHAGLQVIAELLVDVAAAQREAEPDNVSRMLDALQAAVRRREQACVETLLELYSFGREDYAEGDLPLSGGHWQADPFDPETLRHHGIRTSKYVGAGAGAGAMIDIGTGGLSLGAGTVTGALIGTGVGLFRSFGSQLSGHLRGTVRLVVDEPALRLLAWRQLQLLSALIRRGHASQRPLESPVDERWRRGRLPGVLRRSRHHPRWSMLNTGASEEVSRQDAVLRLADQLDDDLRA